MNFRWTLDGLQNENQISNLLYAMHKKDKVIVNQGTIRNLEWKKNV